MSSAEAWASVAHASAQVVGYLQTDDHLALFPLAYPASQKAIVPKSSFGLPISIQQSVPVAQNDITGSLILAHGACRLEPNNQNISLHIQHNIKIMSCESAGENDL